MVMMSEIPGFADGGGGTGGGGGSGTGNYGPAMNLLRIFDPQAAERSRSLDIEIRWSYIEKTQRAGKITPTAKAGDVEVTMGAQVTTYDLGEETVYSSAGLLLRKQLDEDTYEELEVFGLQYTNWVYDGKSVVINAHDAFYKQDEEGFIIPLNQQLLREMSLKDVTQMSYDCTHLVLNCYQVVKKKWYQKGIFKVLLVIVAIVLTVIFPPAGLAALSSTIAVGLGLAAATLFTTILAATLTVLATMLLSKLLTPVLIDVFGEKWGRVLAVIASALTMNFAATGSLLGSLSNMTLNATTLIQGTTAVLNLASAYQQGAMVEWQQDAMADTTVKDAENKLKEIEELTKENLGTNTDLIDIQGFTQATWINMETSNDFLSRTLMTGSDIAAITRGMIEDFAAVGLQLPNTG